jgi:hypothetical protein
VNEKNPVTPSGTEPATFQLVAQCLNRATAFPSEINKHIIAQPSIEVEKTIHLMN